MIELLGLAKPLIGMRDQQISMRRRLQHIGAFEQFKRASSVGVEKKFTRKLQTIGVFRIRIHDLLQELFRFRLMPHLGVGLSQPGHALEGVGLNSKSAKIGVDRGLIMIFEASRVTQEEPEFRVLRSRLGGSLGIRNRSGEIVSLQRILRRSGLAGNVDAGSPAQI